MVQNRRSNHQRRIQTMNKTIIAIDPGNVESAYCLFTPGFMNISPHILVGKVPNAQLLRPLTNHSIKIGKSSHGIDQYLPFETLVIEQVACMGMAVGESVFETVFWSGRFAQAWGREFHRIKRGPIKMHLCGTMRAKDGNIRQALIDKIGPQ